MPIVKRRGWLDGLIIFVIAVTGLYGSARLALQPRDPAVGVGVIFAPWVSSEAALIRAVEAGAQFVRYGGLPFIVVVMPDVPDYQSRILASGALFVADPRALAACLTVFQLK
ncbi:MAG: hypothetical protein HY659_04290 [Rhizobiales bacterium]|nr:hypothetical protein [Hyphomicrobiales bacterium]